MDIIKSIPKNIQLSKDLSPPDSLEQTASLRPELPQGLLKVNSYSCSFSIEADDKYLCCSVIGDALGKCQFVVDTII